MCRLELDVPEELVESLRRQAAAAGRDVKTEAIECLRRGVRARPRTPAEVNALLDDLRRFRATQLKGHWLTPEFIRRARDEGRE